MHLSGRPLAKPYRTRAFFLRIFLPACKKLVVLGHFSFQFELRFFLIWSWSIPVGASKIRCSTRAFAVSKAAVTDHSRHGNAKCEQDSKSGSRASGSWVRIPPYPPKESSKLKGLLDFPFSRILIFPNSCVRTAYFLVENRVQIRFCYLALYSAFHNTTRMPCNRFRTSISPSRRTLVRRDGEIFQRTS